MPLPARARGPLRAHAPPQAPVHRDVKKFQDFTRAAHKDAIDPKVIELAHRLIRPFPPDDYLEQARSIFRWCRDGLRYTPDADWVQDYSDSVAIIDRGWGNCFCKSRVCVALLRAVGIEAEGVPVWSKGPNGAWMSHIQVRLRFPGSRRVPGNVDGWIYGEPTIRGAELTQNPFTLAPNPDTGKLPLSGGPAPAYPSPLD